MATYTGSWSISGTTATCTISDGTTNVATFTVTGLKSDTATSNLNLVFTDTSDYEKGGTITLAAGALPDGPTSVTITTSNDAYKLALASGIQTTEPTATNAWTCEQSDTPASTTATYEATTAKYYVPNTWGTEIVYNPEAVETLATITGLKVGLTSSTFAPTIATNSAGETEITLKKDYLPDGTATATVSLTQGDYNLKLDTTGIATAADPKYTWSVSPTSGDGPRTATYTKTQDAYYTLAGDRKSIGVTAEIEPTTELTIANLNSSVSTNNSNAGNSITGITFGTGANAKVLSLAQSVLVKNHAQPATLTTINGYTLAYTPGTGNDSIPNQDVAVENLWTVAKNGTVTINGTETDKFDVTLAEYKPEHFAVTDTTITYNA